MYTTLLNKIIAETYAVLPPGIIETWLKPLNVDSQSTSETLVISAPNQFICDFVDLHYRQIISELVLKQNALIQSQQHRVLKRQKCPPFL
jgi:chromosomal replication initiation ATPase DnaA